MKSEFTSLMSATLSNKEQTLTPKQLKDVPQPTLSTVSIQCYLAFSVKDSAL